MVIAERIWMQFYVRTERHRHGGEWLQPFATPYQKCHGGDCIGAVMYYDDQITTETMRQTPWPGRLRPSLRFASASRSTATFRPSSDPLISGRSLTRRQH